MKLFIYYGNPGWESFMVVADSEVEAEKLVKAKALALWLEAGEKASNAQARAFYTEDRFHEWAWSKMMELRCEAFEPGVVATHFNEE